MYTNIITLEQNCLSMCTHVHSCLLIDNDVTLRSLMLSWCATCYNKVKLRYDIKQQCTMTFNTMLQYINTTTWCYNDVKTSYYSVHVLNTLLQHCYDNITCVYVFDTMMLRWRYNNVHLCYNCVTTLSNYVVDDISMWH